MFAPGQHVICVDDTPERGREDEPLHPANVIKGTVYTVARLFPEGFMGLRVAGMSVHEKIVPGCEYIYARRRFRPLSPRSISIVESLMAPVNAPGKVTEPA